MAIWPFNRKKKQESDLPKEVQDYYQAEKRERVGVAGLLAVATLVVTVLLAMGLFFGGRWVYRTVFDNDDEPQVAQQDDVNQDVSPSPTEPSDEEDEPETPTPSTPSTPAPTTPSRPSTPTPTTPAPTPTPGPGRDLPNTGPADTAAIVAGTALIGAAGFYVVRRPREEQ